MIQKNRFRASDGAMIAYSDEGEGLPLLCLSGLSRNGSDFDYMMPHLPPGWRVIRMDYRGRGDSDWTGAASYTVPREAQDAVELLDHLGLRRAAMLGTSRGGLIAIYLSATQKDRVAGICLNDIGPALERIGLERIKDYVGRNPAAKSLEEFARVLPHGNPGMDNVPESRWREEAERHALPREGGGLKINYDPALRESFLEAFKEEQPDLWPLYDAAGGVPIGLLRGANSDLLSAESAAEMCRRHPGTFYAEVPDRAHIPFLDEPQSLGVLRDWLAAVAGSGRL